MKYSLKYLVPFLLFIIGISVMTTSTLFYSENEHKYRIERMKERIDIIGKRIIDEIEHKQLYDEHSFSELTRIFSLYSIGSLKMAKIYNEKEELIFKFIPESSSFEDPGDTKEMIKKIVTDKILDIHSHEGEMLIDALFPLAMPLKDSEVDSGDIWAVYLQYSTSNIQKSIHKNIDTYLIANALVIIFIVIALSLLIHFLILKRLTNLSEMTEKLSSGNYNVELDICLNDEIGRINNAFNEMAKKISQNNKELEIKIEEAVEKNLQKNRLMLQQNRLAAMGEMISNIAHQWRQPLNTLGLILQKLEILHKRGTLDEEKLKENITNGMSQINKMSTTIDDFRDFFKKDKKKRIFYLKEAIEESLLFMKTPLEENSIQVTYDRELSVQVNGYKNELTQVIVNIINNAKDALVENKNIDRRIDILCTVKDEHIVIKIEDNAGGIPKDVIDKIFEPYFTTKVEGEGDGIGLYMSKIIIEENMNGKLDVHNSEDGAVLTITLFSDIIDPFCEISYSAEE